MILSLPGNLKSEQFPFRFLSVSLSYTILRSALLSCREGCMSLHLLISFPDERACFGNAAFYECGLDFKLLIGAQIHHGVKG